MEFPAELREKIKSLAERENRAELIAAAERLSENYRNENSDGKISAASKPDVLAYSAVRMPATFAAVSRALELSLECFDGEIGSVLDVGAGTGAGAIAAAVLLDSPKITCLEREKNMIELGAGFLECAGVSAEWILGDIGDRFPEKADLVICSYCVNELSEKQREAALLRLSDAAEKLLVIVEPGTPNSFSAVRKMRGRLLKEGWRVAAPCTSDGECVNDWCHFTARVARSELHRQLKRADAPYEDEKFCFIALAREVPRKNGARILRHPIIEPGKITLELCSGGGVSSTLITRKNPLFKTARKAKTGDMFPLTKEN